MFAVSAQGTHNRETPARTAAPAARSLLSCALWRGMGRLWRGMGGTLPLSQCPRAVAVHAQPHDERRSPLLPPPSGLLPPLRTPKEPC